MKRLILLILTAFLLLSSLTACAGNEAEAAADDLLSRCVACDTEAVAALMGYDMLSLTDIERYTLSRMTYKIVSSEQFDSVRWNVTVDTNLFDIMNLLNEALLFSLMADTTDPDTNRWMLDKLNNNAAPRAGFRAVIPMRCEADGTWTVDGDRIGDDLRDAISGGAYSWYQTYRETFGDGTADDTGTIGQH